MSPNKRVLITGAGGLIGRVLRRALAPHYELRLLSRSPLDVPGHVADIADLQAIQPAFEGVQSVVHLAASSSTRSEWDDVLPANIVGTYNVYEAARRAGVQQVVFASSSHVVGMHERESAPEIYDTADERVLDEGIALRPDSLYGVAKGFGELLARYYSEHHGLKAICLRIGMVVDDEPLRPAPADAGERERQGWLRTRAVWLSQRDCGQLFARALEADELAFTVVYGTSDNPRQMWDLDGARRLLGYRPLDRAPQ
ncbi:NAD-dependent glucose-6-phosphate dehydrogenase Azf [soil metagenome]